MRIIYYIFYFLLLSACYCCSALLLGAAVSLIYPIWATSAVICILMMIFLIVMNPLIAWLIAEKIVRWTNLEDRFL